MRKKSQTILKKLKEEIERFVVQNAAPDHHITEEFIDPEKKVAVFIIEEVLNSPAKSGVYLLTGTEYRYRLCVSREGETKVLFEDHAYSGTPECPGRRCSISNLRVDLKRDKVEITHDTSSTPPYFIDWKRAKIKKLTFKL